MAGAAFRAPPSAKEAVSRMSDTGRRVAPAAILVVAAVLRVAYFLQIRTSPLFSHPVFDAREYAVRAGEVAAGHLFPVGVSIHGPAYPWFLAIFSALSGHDLAVMTFTNVVLGCATVLLLWDATRRCLGDATAAVAAALTAMNWVLIHFEGHLLATTYFTFLMVAAFRLTVAAGARSALGAGLVLGVAALTRPNALAPLPFLAALLAFRSVRTARVEGEAPTAGRRGPDGTGRRRVGRLLRPALLLAGTLVLVLPVVVRNYRTGGGWALQTNTGLNLYLGNAADSPGYPSIRPGREWDELVLAPARAGETTPGGQDAWFRARIVDFARRDPGAFLRLQLRKLLLFWNHREVRTTLSPYFFARFAPLQAAPFLVGFGFLGPLALAGLALSVRRPARFALPWIFTLPSMALVVLTVMGSRYRAPLLPFLAIFAAHTLVEAYRALQDRAWRRAAGIAALVVPAIALVHIRFDDLNDLKFGEETARVAAVYQQAGQADVAARWWAESLREEPDRNETWVSSASLAQARRDWKTLDAITAEGLRRRPDDWLLKMFRGRALLMLDRPDESLDVLRSVLPLRPGDPDLLAGLARAHAAAGRPDSALVWFRRAVDRLERIDPDRANLPGLRAEMERLAGRDPSPGR